MNVQPCYTGPFYFKTWPLPIHNPYTATLDWQGHSPFRALFDLNGNTEYENTNSATAVHSYDLNTFRYDLFGARNLLSVQALTSNGTTSQPFSLSPVGVDLPFWLPFSQMTLEVPQNCGHPMTASWSVLFPTPAFEAQVTPPSWFPYVGGTRLGIVETQAGWQTELSGSGEGTVGITGQTGFEIGKSTVTGSVTGSGDIQIDPQEGVKLDQASFNLKIEGTIEDTKPVIDVFCGLATGVDCKLKQAGV